MDIALNKFFVLLKISKLCTDAQLCNVLDLVKLD